MNEEAKVDEFSYDTEIYFPEMVAEMISIDDVVDDCDENTADENTTDISETIENKEDTCDDSKVKDTKKKKASDSKPKPEPINLFIIDESDYDMI